MSCLYAPRRDKTCLWVCDKVRFKPVSVATKTSEKIEILLEASLDMILSNKLITKALISLRGCVGWSEPLLFFFLQTPEDSFSRVEAQLWNLNQCKKFYF